MRDAEPGAPAASSGTGDAQGTLPATVDPTRCPLCGGPNTCAMETARATGQPQPPCWCTQVDFSAELLARVPPEAQRRACICARCAASENPATTASVTTRASSYR
ncbi:MAG: cysteine-rich CWC family protein [Ramlibacter sp.]|uniref:cysteine-rich CWC family protein n=1 Tax=Ramlibacter sp. TaxID=1917967 RepID=UPI002605E228|nr:cysteine-rich CWC family protein [Ramlibacter sp.]MDH4376197.1 cysteine-rich CWC family protein [Ramlibacter sp.]